MPKLAFNFYEMDPRSFDFLFIVCLLFCAGVKCKPQGPHPLLLNLPLAGLHLDSPLYTSVPDSSFAQQQSL